MANKSPKLSSLSGPNAIYYILKATKLYSQKLGITQSDDNGVPREKSSGFEYNPEVLTGLGLILGNRGTRRVAFYALDVGALTLRIVTESLNLTHSSASRSIECLIDLHIIAPSLPLTRPRGSGGGRRVTVYQTPEATPDQIMQAITLQRQLESYKYRLAVRCAQSIMEDYLEPRHLREILYGEIVTELRGRGVPEILDVAGLVAPLLTQRGVKVWRS